MFQPKGDRFAAICAAWVVGVGIAGAAETGADYGPFVSHCTEASFPTKGNFAYKGVVVKLADGGTVNHEIYSTINAVP